MLFVIIRVFCLPRGTCEVLQCLGVTEKKMLGFGLLGGSVPRLTLCIFCTNYRKGVHLFRWIREYFFGIFQKGAWWPLPYEMVGCGRAAIMVIKRSGRQFRSKQVLYYNTFFLVQSILRSHSKKIRFSLLYH